VTLVILAIAVIFVARSTWIVYQKKQESEELKNISLKYKSGLEERDRELQSQIDRLGTEAGKESEIRSKFSMAKDKENIVVIVNDDSNATKTATSSKSLWQKFLDLFKK
jgi:uncharacterized ion transporter superfamily protein YfcC